MIFSWKFYETARPIARKTTSVAKMHKQLMPGTSFLAKDQFLGVLFRTPQHSWRLSKHSRVALRVLRGTHGRLQMVPGRFLGALESLRKAPGTISDQFWVARRVPGSGFESIFE